MNADVLENYDEAFVREDMVEMVLNNTWPE
jgi:hypothetical protein